MRLGACLAGVTISTLLLVNCGDGALSLGTYLDQQAAGSSATGSSFSSSSAPSGWVDLMPTFPGHTVATAAVVPGQDKLLTLTAATRGGAAELYSSEDGGGTWQQLGQGAGSAPLTLSPAGISFDAKDGSGHSFWIFGFFAGGSSALLSTTDGGNTFTAHALGTAVNEIDGVSVDAASDTILAGQHEETQAVYRSSDGGVTWTNVGTSLPPEPAAAEYPYVIDAQTYLLGLSAASASPHDTGERAPGAPSGVFRTADGGATWTQVAQGYNVFGSPTLSNGVLYWGYVKDGDGGILASTDQGRTWRVLVPGGLTWSVLPDVLPSGQLATLNTASQITLFTPGADTQPEAVLPALPLSASAADGPAIGLAFDAARNAYFGWAGDAGIQRLDMRNPQ